MNPGTEKFAGLEHCISSTASNSVSVWEAVGGISSLASVLVAFVGVIAALTIWRRQARYASQLDIASEALNLCDDIDAAILNIRSTNVFNWEHAERESTEMPEESELRHYRNAAFAKIKRLENYSETFDRFFKLRARFSAYFGKQHEQEFGAVRGAHRDMQVAAELFGERLPHSDDPDYDKISRMEENRRKVLFDWGKLDDPIRSRVDPPLKSIREACLEAIQEPTWRERLKAVLKKP